MKRAARRLYGRTGMTLVGTPMAVLTTTLLTPVILIGSQAAAHATMQDTLAVESQLVTDTTNRVLSDVLRYAKDITIDSTRRVAVCTSSERGIDDGLLRVGTGEFGTQDTGHIYPPYMDRDKDASISLSNNLSYSGLTVVPADYMFGSNVDISGFDLYYSGGVLTGNYHLYNSAYHLLSDFYESSFRAVDG